ncbi:beta-galactosidase-like isoform X1 [Apostichopus japonicus]|uniref:beta-galactosidase-like isoform X1 n=2 Tax=Stichopus japonicus TaxID=307972 RepID=UPI003AB6B281
MILAIFWALAFSTLSGSSLLERSFQVDYGNDTFLKDGEPFRYVSGSIHYARIHPDYWQDRLQKMYSAGLNAIELYIPWNLHEPNPGEYNFEGGADLLKFLRLANETGLLVILRPGPYMCSEWDLGGLPAWLLKHTSIALRTSDENYLQPATKWMNKLLSMVKPFLYKYGGPIILVQIENEYGSYPACDYTYMEYLHKLFVNVLGDDVVYFTTDGPSKSMLTCGMIKGVLATIDFRAVENATAHFDLLRSFQPNGPLVNSEFYTGWLDHWGEPHQTLSTSIFTKSLDNLLSMGVNVNMYMFEGGTNFAFWTGGNYKNGMYRPQCSTHDYDAPLSEAGDPTEKYYAIREVISKYLPLPPQPVPQSTPKASYNAMNMQFFGSLLDVLQIISPHGPIKSKYPVTMEMLNQYHGFMLYRTTVPTEAATTGLLNCSGIRDRGYVMVNGISQGVLERITNPNINITFKSGDTLDILVENQGHINYGIGMYDPKGIYSNVTLNGTLLLNWSMYPLTIDKIILEIKKNSHRSTIREPPAINIPSFYYSEVILDPNNDTFLDPMGWSKGQAFLNDFNLGRYWPTKGPQVTLYIPAPVIDKGGKNMLILLELESAGETIRLLDKPILDGPV